MIAFVLRIGSPSPGLDAATAAKLSAFAGLHSPRTFAEGGAWSSADNAISCQWVAHAPAELGGVRYTYSAGTRFALFAGRPVIWGRQHADGLGAIDPSTYLGAPLELLERLDGRFAIIDVAGSAVRLVTDPVGLLPVFVSHRNGASWLSNVAPLISEATDPVRETALVAFLLTGNAITGEPMSNRVRRVEPGTLTTFFADGQQSASPLNRVSPDNFQQGPPDYEQAARDLVAVAAAFADWPDRERSIELSGGHDSRLVGAALRMAGVKASAMSMAIEHTPGYPLTEDVELGRVIAGLLGFDHQILYIDDSSAIYRSTDAVATLLNASSPGTIAWNDIPDLLLESPPHAPRPALVFDGLGGEVARGAFDHQWGRAGNFDGYRNTQSKQGLVDGLMQRYIPTHVQPLATPLAIDMFRMWLADFVERTTGEGFALCDVPELCFIRWIGTWHGMKTTPYEYRQDGISPLISRRLWTSALSQPLEDRMNGRFHRELTSLLGPDLLDTPYCSRSAHYGGRQQRIRDRWWLRHRAEIETRAASERGTRTNQDPVAGIQRRVKDRMSAANDHPVWKYLDANRVTEILNADPIRFRRDIPARQQVWRLATILS